MANAAEVGVKDRVFNAEPEPLQERGLPLPDVQNASMAEFEPDADVQGDIFVAPEPSEQEQQQPQPDKQYKNPHARARYVENEKKDLEIKLDRLTDAVNALMSQGAVDTQPYAEPEEEIDPEINPVGYLTRQIQELRDVIAVRDQAEAAKIQMSAVEKAERAANMAIQSGMQQAPEMFNGAIMHLAGILDRNLERKYPNLTYDERLAVANDQIKTMKVRWVAEGRNPAQEMLEMAYTYGWTPHATRQDAPQAPQKQDARGKVRAQRDRASSVATIGGVQGSAPRKITAKELKSMDMKTFNHTINQMISSGDAVPNRSIGKTPSFSDLLPGKGIPTR